jgi:hypothetical protein
MHTILPFFKFHGLNPNFPSLVTKKRRLMRAPSTMALYSLSSSLRGSFRRGRILFLRPEGSTSEQLQSAVTVLPKAALDSTFSFLPKRSTATSSQLRKASSQSTGWGPITWWKSPIFVTVSTRYSCSERTCSFISALNTGG